MTGEFNVRLAEELRKLHLGELATRAADGHFGDFTSPFAAPKMVLADELFTKAEMSKDPDKQQGILALRKRVMGGEFDG